MTLLFVRHGSTFAPRKKQVFAFSFDTSSGRATQNLSTPIKRLEEKSCVESLASTRFDIKLKVSVACDRVPRRMTFPRHVCNQNTKGGYVETEYDESLSATFWQDESSLTRRVLGPSFFL